MFGFFFEWRLFAIKNSFDSARCTSNDRYENSIFITITNRYDMINNWLNDWNIFHTSDMIHNLHGAWLNRIEFLKTATLEFLLSPSVLYQEILYFNDVFRRKHRHSSSPFLFHIKTQKTRRKFHSYRSNFPNHNISICVFLFAFPFLSMP